jgi:hypothetical protein
MVGVNSNTWTIDATFTEIVEWLRVLVTLASRMSWVLILPCLERVASLAICGVGLSSSMLILSNLILMHRLPSVVVILFFL